MTPEAQSKAARQRNELRAQAETIARLRREKMELLRDLRAAEAKNARFRVALMQMVGATVYLPHDGFSKPHEHESSRIARAALGETSDD